MKVFVLCTMMLLFLQASIFSQTAAIDGKVTYQRGEKPAAIIELPYTADVVEGALRQSLAKSGVKEEKLKGMQVFKGARLSPTDGEVADLYFKVDRKGRKDDKQAVIFLIVGRPNENVAIRAPDDAYRLQEGKAFLDGLLPSVEAYDLEQNILKQEEVIKKAEKELKNLADDQKNIEGRIHDLQDKLSQNKMDQDNKNSEIIKERTVRDALLSKRIVTTP